MHLEGVEEEQEEEGGRRGGKGERERQRGEEGLDYI